MKWRMTFITLTIACGIAQADFLVELSDAQDSDHKYRLDLPHDRMRTAHAAPGGLHATPSGGGQGIALDNRHVRDWYQRIEESGTVKTPVRDASPGYR